MTTPRKFVLAIGATAASARAQIEAVGPVSSDAPVPAPGDVLTWDGTSWVPGGGGGASASGLVTLGAVGTALALTQLVSATSRFVLTVQDGGTLARGNVQVTARSIGGFAPNFTITSSAGAADAGAIVYWQLWEA